MQEDNVSCVLGIDVGTTGVKAVLLGPDLQALATGWRPCTLRARQPGWAEEAPDEWWDAVCGAVHTCLDTSEVQPERILAVGVSGMVPALVLLGREMDVLRPWIQQNDARAHVEIEELNRQFGQEEIFQRTGSSLSQQSIGPKLLWLARHEPDVFARIRYMLGSYDFVNWKLTGMLAIEQNWALESGLYDVTAGDWYGGMLDAVGCSRPFLPRIVRPTDQVGSVNAEAARRTGLHAGTPVFGGSADHVAAALSAGLRTEGDVLIKVGGAGDILTCLERWETDPRMFIDHHDIPGMYLMNGCMAASGSVLKWFAGLVSPPEQAEGLSGVYAELDESAAEIPAGSAGLVVLPYFLGEKTPLFDPLARGVFFGLTLTHGRAHIHRAIMEAVAYGFQHHLEVLGEIGLRAERVFVCDGGARSGLWRRILADVTGQTLHYIGEHQGSCAGVAFVAGVAAGLFDWDDIGKLAVVSSVTEPRADEHIRYERFYGIYRGLYSDLRERFRELGSIGSETV